MHAGLKAEALSGTHQSATLRGGENLSGGEAANGMPRNLFTVAVADGNVVVVPINGPEPTTTVGRENDNDTKQDKRNKEATEIAWLAIVSVYAAMKKLPCNFESVRGAGSLAAPGFQRYAFSKAKTSACLRPSRAHGSSTILS